MEMQINIDSIMTQRNNRAWSQSQLAEASGLSLRTVQRIEKSGVASIESVKALASVYEVSIEDLKAFNEVTSPPTGFSITRMTKAAKAIAAVVFIPVVVAALYLLWTDHSSMAWVDGLRDSIFSDTISQDRRDKISFLIAVIVVGVPSLIPAFLYDVIKKQGNHSF